MGIDLTITTNKTPCFSKAVLAMIQDLEPDYLNLMAQHIFYYRDSFNKSNLASVIDLCYWTDFQGGSFVSRWSFLGKLAKITDKQIEDYAKDRKNLGCNHYTILTKEKVETDNFDELELIDLLKNKRDYLTNLLDAEIIRIEGG